MSKKGNEICVLLHDIRSVHNVGSIFRTADALGVSTVYLSGYTPTPLDRFERPRKDFAKVSLGAEKTLTWEYEKEPNKIIDKLRKQGFQIIGLEQTKDSVDYKKVVVKYPVLFIIGNEVEGINKKLLEICDTVAEIPMRGEKESLNVSVAFGIGLSRMLNM